MADYFSPDAWGASPWKVDWSTPNKAQTQAGYPFQGTPTIGSPGPAPTPQVPNAPGAYTPSPTPQQGNNPFGYIPGQIGLPNPGADLAKQIPGLPGLNNQATGVLSSYLGGELPADVQAAIQDAGARFGVTSGMPGSGLARNRTARDLGLTSLDLTGKGLAALNPFVQSTSATQTVNPALQVGVAETNAINAAAPDPTQAASYAKQLYDQYLQTVARTGGPAGGTGAFSGTGGARPYTPVNPYSSGPITPPARFSGGGSDYGYSPTGYGAGAGYGSLPQAQPYIDQTPYGTAGISQGGVIPQYTDAGYFPQDWYSSFNDGVGDNFDPFTPNY